MNITFAKDVLERAGKTFVQVLAAAWIANQSNIIGFDWKAALLVSLSAAITSVLTSFLSAGVTQKATASLLTASPYEQPMVVAVGNLSPVTPTVDTKVPDLYGDVDKDSATLN